MTAPIRIFLLTDSAMRRELWRTVLTTPGQVCLSDFAELDPQTPIDVVVTDHDVDVEWRGRLAAADAEPGGMPSGFDGGVITVGRGDEDSSSGVAPQDPTVESSSVALPANATARELKLGVLLVNQIIRLRRADNAQDRLLDTYEQLAFQDPLTSLANRRGWDQELSRRWDPRPSAQGSICLALFDVDQLKQINDALGHAEGDAVLRATADALSGSVRDEDLVARLGGDEFGVLLTAIDPASAQKIVDRIRCSSSRYLATGEASPEEIPVTTSAGYACRLPDDSAESLFRRADDALRSSKQAGGNTTRGSGR